MQDADVVLFIHRPNLFEKKGDVTDEERAQTELKIAKQRNGPTGKVTLYYRKQFVRFENYAPV